MRKHFLFCLFGFYFVLGLADLPKLNLSDNEESKLIMDIRSVKPSDSNMICKNKSGLPLPMSTPYPDNANGFDENDINRDTGIQYDLNGYDKNGFNAAGWNAERINKETETVYDVYDANGYDVDLRRAWYPEGWVPNFNTTPAKSISTGRNFGNSFYDENGNLYVNDTYNKRIAIYNTSGTLIKTINLNSIFSGYTGYIYSVSYDAKTGLIYCSLANGKGFRAVDKNGNVVNTGWTGNGNVSYGMQFIGNSIYVMNSYASSYTSGATPTTAQLLRTVTVHDRSNPSNITETISVPSQMPSGYRFTGFTIDNNGNRYFLGCRNSDGANSTIYVTDKNGQYIKSISLPSIPDASGLNIDSSGNLVVGAHDYYVYFLNPIL